MNYSRLVKAFAELRSKPSFWWMAIAASLVAFVGYGLISFQAPFLQREHGLSVRAAALQQLVDHHRRREVGGVLDLEGDVGLLIKRRLSCKVNVKSQSKRLR